MSKEYVVNHLDIAAFTKAGQSLQGSTALSAFARLLQELPVGSDAAELSVHWQVTGEFVPEAGGAGQNWLYLQAQTQLPLTCQHCLQPVQVPLQVDGAFRFVKDEATAELQDEECEEDLLVMSRSFDLMALIEDELLMALPLVPRHTECPQPLDFDAEGAASTTADAAPGLERPHPFAALAALRTTATPVSSENVPPSDKDEA